MGEYVKSIATIGFSRRALLHSATPTYMALPLTRSLTKSHLVSCVLRQQKHAENSWRPENSNYISYTKQSSNKNIKLLFRRITIVTEFPDLPNTTLLLQHKSGVVSGRTSCKDAQARTFFVWCWQATSKAIDWNCYFRSLIEQILSILGHAVA
jgi:hypothetical protein